MFRHKLALQLGCTVRELNHRVSAKELIDWYAFYYLQPFGDERADLRNALTSCIIANAFRKKGSRSFKPKDFMPFAGPSAPQTADEQKQQLQLIAAQMQGFAKQQEQIKQRKQKTKRKRKKPK